MKQSGLTTVAGYIAKQPAPTRRVLAKVRSILRAALPRAEEVISYQIPAYRQDGAVVVFFAGWKAHWSIYPASEALVAELGVALAPYEVAKGTIRFPLDRAVPRRLVARIARVKAAEVAAQATSRPRSKSKSKSKSK